MKKQSLLDPVIGASRVCFLLVAAAFAIAVPARAVLIVNWQQTGSDVTATWSGTIDAAWGSATFLPGTGGAGGYNDAFGGFNPTWSEIRVGYGNFFSGYDNYFLAGTTFSTPISITGTQLTGGVVQSGYTPSYSTMDLGPNYVGLSVSPGATSFNTSIVWSNKQLSDFFASGVPVLTDIYNSSSQKLLTLQIGNAAPVPEPGTWAAAALLVGGASFLRWRKRRV